MKLTGVIAVETKEQNRFDKTGQSIWYTVGFRVSGRALEFAESWLDVPEGATSDVRCETFITLNRAEELLKTGVRILGLTYDGSLQLARNTHSYDYPLYISEPIASCTSEEYAALESSNNAASRGYFLGLRGPNNNILLYGTPKASSMSRKMTLVAQALTRNTVTGEMQVNGYEVSFNGQSRGKLIELSAIATNAALFECENFIVKTNQLGEYVFSAKAGYSLKDLPVVKVTEKAKVGKEAKKADDAKAVVGQVTGDIDIASVCSLMKKFKTSWLKLSKKVEGTKLVENHEFDFLGIDVAEPTIKYSQTSLNVNFTFRKMATTQIDFIESDGGRNYKQVNCFSYATRSLYDTKGAKGLDDVYLLCSGSDARNFIFEMKVQFGLELTESKKTVTKMALGYLNSGILGKDDFVVLEGDLSRIKSATQMNHDWISCLNIRQLVSQMYVWKASRTYLRKYLTGLSTAIDAMSDLTGEKIPEKSICKSYADYNKELLGALVAVGIDVHSGSFEVEQVFVPGYKETIKYSIAKVPNLTSKDFTGTLSEVKSKILSDKNTLKKAVYEPLFNYLENFANTVVNFKTNLEKYDFAVASMKQIEENLEQATEYIWYYNQWAVSGISSGSEIYIYDNGSPDIVGSLLDKVDCVIPYKDITTEAHNHILIAVDPFKVKFANAEQRGQNVQAGKFTKSVFAEVVNNYDVLENQNK